MVEKLNAEEKLKIILFDENFRNKFWSYVDKSTGGDSCWNWTGAPHDNEKKYGLVKIKGNNSMNTHRISLTMKLGHFPIADALHSAICKGNKKCVNPNHLRDGSPHENRSDENIAGKTQRQQKRRKELFETLIEESSKAEKMFFYEYLFKELFTKK